MDRESMSASAVDSRTSRRSYASRISATADEHSVIFQNQSRLVGRASLRQCFAVLILQSILHPPDLAQQAT